MFSAFRVTLFFDIAILLWIPGDGEHSILFVTAGIRNSTGRILGPSRIEVCSFCTRKEAWKRKDSELLHQRMVFRLLSLWCPQPSDLRIASFKVRPKVVFSSIADFMFLLSTFFLSHYLTQSYALYWTPTRKNCSIQFILCNQFNDS